jgi:hypothetical protein
MPAKPLPFAKTPEFYTALGYFYAIWSQIELTIGYATWKALGSETPEEAHARIASTKFSDQCKKLRTLLESNKISNGERVKELLTQIEDSSMRNVFAHSFMATDEHWVTFVHRKIGRRQHGKKYEVTACCFSRQDFFNHVQNFQQLCLAFNQAVVGQSEKEFRTFAAMAIPLAADAT